jgi:4-hydroxyacetophenone monooxygenase
MSDQLPDPAVLAADPDRLRAALAAADAATLLLVLVQFTGDSTWLTRARPFITGPMSYQEKMPPELRQAIRERLFEVLMEHARTRRPLPGLPGGPLLRDMLSIAAGEVIGDEYVAMMSEELSPPPDVPPIVDWNQPPGTQGTPGTAATSGTTATSGTAATAGAGAGAFHVLIVGAGMSGLCAAIRLKQAGIPFTILEKNETVGGTWFENSYPGCGVDTPNHFYSYSFAPHHDWSQLFAKRRELWMYFERIADEYDIRSHVRFNTEVVSAVFDEAASLWHVTANGANDKAAAAAAAAAANADANANANANAANGNLANGSVVHLEANAVISCVGVLNRPKLPEIPGIEDFQGPAFHTAQWPADFDWRGKRVAMIGTGASGHQVGPTIAPDVERLTIFQRSPHWVVPNPNYFAEVPDGVKWLLAHLPYYLRWYRFQLFWGFSDGLYAALQIDPAWGDPARSINRINERHRRFMERHMRSELGEDSALLEKVTPDYPPYGKRILIDNHWFKMLKRPNVDLVTTPITRINAQGVETNDGRTWPADALVFATGFKASKMLAPMNIRGRGGREIHEVWGPDDAAAYLGITVPAFPNFFILLGPNTGLAHGGNAIFMVECQVRHVIACLRELMEKKARTIEVRQEVNDRYIQAVDALHRGLVWSHPGVDNWYKNQFGRVFALSPWRLVEYWRLTTQMNPQDYVFQ